MVCGQCGEAMSPVPDGKGTLWICPHGHMMAPAVRTPWRMAGASHWYQQSRGTVTRTDVVRAAMAVLVVLAVAGLVIGYPVVGWVLLVAAASGLVVLTGSRRAQEDAERPEGPTFKGRPGRH